MITIPDTLKSFSSRLCIGIDPRTTQGRVEFARNLIEKTHEYAVAYKPNIQFWHGTSLKDIQQINQKIHDYDLPSIADLKLSDIGSTNESGMRLMKEMGFDYLTVSPFPGNIKQTAELAKDIGIGIICLVVMSNPEASWMVETGMYTQWAKDAEQYADGIVVGTTNHITHEILRNISEICKTPFILAPGIGSQGGNITILDSLFPHRVIYNVSRSIGNAEDPESEAQRFFELVTSN